METKKKRRGLVSDICTVTFRQSLESDPSLVSGHAGRALAMAIVAAVGGDKIYRRHAADHIEEALRLAGNQDLTPSLYHGFAGIALVAEQLQSRRLVPLLCDLSDIDRLLLDYVETRSSYALHDVVQGLIGIGLYFLERNRRTSYRAHIDAVVAALARTATLESDGLSWRATTNAMLQLLPAGAPHGHIADLGVAHGSAGVVLFLARVLRDFPDSTSARSLLSSSVRFLLAQEMAAPPASRFPHVVGMGTDAQAIQRVAWCYGDLGVGYALAEAGKCGETFARPSAERTILSLANLAPASIVHDADDPTYCHGSAGRAHLLHMLALMFRSQLIGMAAESHLQHAINHIFTPVAGSAATCEILTNRSLLNGPAGVALVLATWSERRVGWWSHFLLVG